MTQKKRRKTWPIDRSTLHAALVARVDERNRLTIHQSQLAAELGVSMFRLNRMLNEFIREGRIRRTQNMAHNVGVYEVLDPRLWRWRINSRDRDAPPSSSPTRS